MIHRLIDGGKEESYAGHLSRAGDEEDHGDKDVAKMHEEEAHMNVRTETLWKGGEGAGDNIALK